MDIQRFKELTPRVSNQTIASALRKTALMLSRIGTQIGADDSVSVVVNEAAKRLEIMQGPTMEVQVLKQIEDLSRRVIDTITPENVALGHTWLKRKLAQVIAAN